MEFRGKLSLWLVQMTIFILIEMIYCTPSSNKPVNSENCYAIISKLSGLAIQLNPDTGKFVQNVFVNDKSQKFKVELMDKDTYSIVTMVNGKRLTAVSDGSVQLSNATTEHNNQLWKITPIPDDKNALIITSIGLKNCMDLESSSTSKGANIITYGCHENENQRWYIVPALCKCNYFDIL